MSLDDDLARRDFTVNAIAYHPTKDELRDPFEGRVDLQRGLIRAVGKADERMREDRLRALRGIRFASRFDFHIEPATWAAIVASAPHMGRLSPERVKQELEKTMDQVRKPSIALEWWRAELGDAIDAALRAGAPAGGDLRRWVARIGRMRTEAFFTLNAALWRARLEGGEAISRRPHRGDDRFSNADTTG